MEVNEAKKPSDSPEWDFVDIYLFSNGQQQTPPRKYHLRIQELNNWEATLRSLAHSQYETIFSTIDLYTVEGQKVLTPMQITQGLAYVAVPPKDTFIPAGYTEYLMKASRSREKRKSTNFSYDGSEPKVGKDLEIKEASIIEEEQEVTATTLIPHQAKNPVPSTKTADRKVSMNKTSVLKKDGARTSQINARRTSIKNKDNVDRKGLKVNTINVGPTAPTVAERSNSNVVQPKTKLITKTNKSTENETTTILPIDIAVVDVNTNSNMIHEKNITTEGTALCNILDDKELIVVKNPDSDTTATFLERDKSASLFTRQARLSPIVPVLSPIKESRKSELHKDDVPLTLVGNIVENVYKPDIDLSYDAKADSTNKTNLNRDIALAQETALHDKISFSKKSTADCSVGVVDKRDVVNLNLKIEIHKNDGVVSAQYDTCPTKMHSIINMGSQTNVDKVLINCTKHQSKCTDNPILDDNTSKVIVVQCVCCNQHNFDEILNKINTAMKLDDKNYIVVLPYSQNDKNVEGCKKDRHTSSSSAASPKDQRISSAEIAVKKVFASTWIHELMRSFDEAVQNNNNRTSTDNNTRTNAVQIVHSTHDVGVESSKAESRVSEDIGKFDVSLIKRIDKMSSVSSIGRMEKRDSIKLHTHQTIPLRGTQIDDIITRRCVTNSPKFTRDKETQTDWCSMLLEARRHENGAYSFHLPPLQVLKYYGF